MRKRTWAAAVVLAGLGAPGAVAGQPAQSAADTPSGAGSERPGQSDTASAVVPNPEVYLRTAPEPLPGAATSRSGPVAATESHSSPGPTAGAVPRPAQPSTGGNGSVPAAEPTLGVPSPPPTGAGSHTVVEAPTGAPSTSAASDDDPESRWKSKPDLDFGGFVHALYALHDGDTTPSQAFEVTRARFGVELSQGELLDGQLDLELSAGSARASEVLRDAYVRVSPLRALRLRMGQFKKPFSAMELWGRRTNPLISRGAGNDWITETLGYGGRDIGAQLEGRVLESPRVDYALGVFNGSGDNAADAGESKDFVARVEIRPVEWLEAGASGSLKAFDDGGGRGLPARGAMAEVDIRAETKRLTVLAEGAYGQNYLSIDHAKTWSALILLTYKIPLTETWKLKLEPLAMAEVLKVEDHVRNAHVLAGAAGANLHIGKLFRLMVQGEALRPMENALDLWTDSNRLLVQAALNLR